MGLMSESVPVRCPACRREHVYAAPSYPCVCGAPVAPPLDQRGVATVVNHRVWDEDWIAVRCAACGRLDEWPYPELGCPCGTLLRIPVAGAEPTSEPAARTPKVGGAEVEGRPAFQPVTIRTARDAVTAAALYLRWLGYRDIRRADQRPPSGIGLAARGILAQVDPTVRPASLRDVECLWLTAMTESTECVYFSLAGYADDARARADALRIPLFVLDLTGTPQPVNELADQLDAAGS
ncbi:hypothetical protein [Streptomyces sp. NPDC051572]|uniref:hypothetical protein n=1 Tax=unclassified Streptomyces TaxID=2593676 RepID=UPI0034510AAF|nr:hypothetical protein OG496_43470 [Streptomyces sp. NBC_00988]